MLPGVDGFGVLKAMRERGGQTPVLMLTARDRVEDRVRGLQEGADDHLVKPFAFSELLARVGVAARAAGPDGAANATAAAPADLSTSTSPAANRAPRRHAAGPHRQKEFTLLTLLPQARQVLSRTTLAEQVWDMNFDPTPTSSRWRLPACAPSSTIPSPTSCCTRARHGYVPRKTARRHERVPAVQPLISRRLGAQAGRRHHGRVGALFAGAWLGEDAGKEKNREEAQFRSNVVRRSSPSSCTRRRGGLPEALRADARRCAPTRGWRSTRRRQPLHADARRRARDGRHAHAIRLRRSPRRLAGGVLKARYTMDFSRDAAFGRSWWRCSW